MAKPLFINADPITGEPKHNANELRQAMALALQYDGRNLGARQGVRPGGNQLQVSLAGSVITVQPGLICIDPGLTTAQGPYWVAIPAAENPIGGPLAAADATNPRKDIVVARVYDHDQDASGLRTARTEYIAGAAGPVPSAPQTPAGAVLLATIDVPRSGNGAPAVTNIYPFTVAAGGILPVRTQAEEDAITPYAYDGMPIWRMDLKVIRVFNAKAGAGWRRSDWNASWGRVGGKRYLGGAATLLASSPGTDSSTNMTTGPVALTKARSYEIRWSMRLQVSVAGAVLILLIRQDSPTGPARGYDESPWPAAATYYEHRVTGYYDCTADETRTFFATSQMSAGNVNFYAGDGAVPVIAEVVDMGPTLLTAA